MTTIDLDRVNAVIFDTGGAKGYAGVAGLGRTAADLYHRVVLRGVKTAVVGLGRGGDDADADEPDPGVLLAAARGLGAGPEATAVVAGSPRVAAVARRAGFAAVADGAAAVELHIAPRILSTIPDAVQSWDTVEALLRERRLAVFLDFDGTLSPIVDRPDEARLTRSGGPALERLSRLCPVAIVSGRDLADVRRKAGVEALWYAGSHGFEVADPDGETHAHPEADQAVADLAEARRQLNERLRDLPGAIVEDKHYALAAHYRMVDADRASEVVDAVADVGAHYPTLRMTSGRKVAELRPNIDWDKGKALFWLLDQIAPGDDEILPLYAGDDLTDEDALAAIAERGFGVVVVNYELGDRPTAAHVAAADPEEFCTFLDLVSGMLEEGGGSS